MSKCTSCKWYEPGDETYGEQVNVSYRSYCSSKPNMSNLKQFPFEKRLQCFESGIAAIETTE